MVEKLLAQARVSRVSQSAHACSKTVTDQVEASLQQTMLAQPFGQIHHGFDLRAPVGLTPDFEKGAGVLAALAQIVETFCPFALEHLKECPGEGDTLTIAHAGGKVGQRHMATVELHQASEGQESNLFRRHAFDIFVEHQSQPGLKSAVHQEQVVPFVAYNVQLLEVEQGVVHQS